MESKTTRRHLGRLALVGAVAASGSGLISSCQSFAKVDEKTEIEQAVVGLRQAILEADKNKLESLTADQLSYGLWPSHGIQNKSEFIRVIVDKQTIYRSIIYSNSMITIAGSNAIVRHTETVEADSGGKIKVEFSVLQVWQKQGGQWRLLARQAFKI